MAKERDASSLPAAEKSSEDGSITRIRTVVSMFSGCGGMDLGFSGGFNYGGNQYPTESMEKQFDQQKFPPNCLVQLVIPAAAIEAMTERLITLGYTDSVTYLPIHSLYGRSSLPFGECKIST